MGYVVACGARKKKLVDAGNIGRYRDDVPSKSTEEKTNVYGKMINEGRILQSFYYIRDVWICII